MLPPAPRRGSGTSCWPIAGAILAASRRATASVPPAKGRITRIGRAGYDCAEACAAASAAVAIRAAAIPRRAKDPIASSSRNEPHSTGPARAERAPMSGAFDARLRALPGAMLRSLNRGIEKESLRVEPDGVLALTPHSRALGSALTHPHITTDFSESLIELITGVHTAVASCLEELERIHQFVYRRIGDELLWGASMPCCLPNEQQIPIARYGTSNVAQAKTVYRVGLTHRYGKRMQMIAGLHYNWSMPEGAWKLPGFPDASTGYFALIRNFRRN